MTWRWWLRIGINETALMRPSHYYWRDALSRFQQHIVATQRAMGIAMVPAFQEAARAFTSFAEVYRSFAKTVAS